MKFPARIPAGLAVCLALLVQACATAPLDPGDDPDRLKLYEERFEALSARADWSLKGRLAIRDENDGGSGSLQWQEGPQGTRMDFHGALGRGAWRLQVDEDGAVLELADGNRFHSDTVQDLVHEQIGWPVPVESLAWWVRGLEAPGDSLSRRLGEDGTLEFLSQHGWEIQFDHYRPVGSISLPLRLTARMDERSVKLAIRNWSLGRRND